MRGKGLLRAAAPWLNADRLLQLPRLSIRPEQIDLHGADNEKFDQINHAESAISSTF